MWCEAGTSATLLDRARDPNDSGAWQHFVQLYSPLISHWLRRHHFQDADVDDLTQEVLAVVARKLPDFRYDTKQGRFRGWLRTILANCIRNFLRERRSIPTATGDSDFQASLEQLEDSKSDLSEQWTFAHDWFILLGIVEQLESEFEPTTIQAFRRTVLDGASASEASAELGVSVNAVLLAKSRVLKRLREEMMGLTD